VHAARLRALLVVPALLFAGCSADGQDVGARPTAEVAPAADCLAPQVLEALDLAPADNQRTALPPSSTAHSEVPARGRVPESFTATGVLVCVPGGSLVDGQGTWSSVVATRRDGDVTALRKALALGDVKSKVRDVCGKPPPVDLWLTDALGRGIRVEFPSGACEGEPREEVTDALEALGVTDVATYQVELLEPAPTPSG
jgi:hypothetical protein